MLLVETITKKIDTTYTESRNGRDFKLMRAKKTFVYAVQNLCQLVLAARSQIQFVLFSHSYSYQQLRATLNNRATVGL